MRVLRYSAQSLSAGVESHTVEGTAIRELNSRQAAIGHGSIPRGRQ